MRWEPRTIPELYSKRARQGFLLLPKKAFLTGVGYQWRWLEYAYWDEEYQSGGRGWQPDYWKQP